jgi:pimeloyl-ACP methyl ester carboxylesterase
METPPEASPNPYLAPPVHFAPLPTGIRMAYRRFGAPGGRRVLAIHGVTGSNVSFGQVAPELAGRGDYDVIALDLRGHGHSDAPLGEPYSIDQHVADVVALARHLDLGAAHVVGHSLGSFVAWALAASNPQLAESLTLIGSAARVQGNPRLAQMRQAAVAFGAYPREARLDRDFLADWFADATLNWDPLFAEAVQIGSTFAPARAFGLAIRGVDPDPRRLALVKQPTQIIHGTADGFFTKSDQLDLIGSLASATVLYQSKAGYVHDTHWPGRMGSEVARDIDAFLGVLDGGAQR